MIIRDFRGYSPKFSRAVFLAENCVLIGDVDIGEDSSIWYNTVLRGDVHYIRVGKRVSIQDGTIVHVQHYTKEDRSDGYPTIIEDDVTVGHNAMLHGCKIGEGSLIGMCATILNGAVIGENSIVGANSLITQDKKYPSRSLIVGSPAKVIRELSENEVASLYKSANNYVGFKNEYLS